MDPPPNITKSDIHVIHTQISLGHIFKDNRNWNIHICTVHIRYAYHSYVMCMT